MKLNAFLSKFFSCTLILLIFLLVACQPKEEQNEAPPPRTQRLDEAASINTQLGLAYLRQGDRPRAKRKLLLAQSQSPGSPEVNAALGYFMEKSGEMSEAEKYYRKALTDAPGQGSQLNNYGTFLCRQGKYTQAELYFLKAVKDVQYENTAAAYENAGLCALAIPDNTKAITYFTKALEQDPSRKQSLFELVNMAMKAKRTDDALSYLKKYSALTLQDPTLLALAIEAAKQAGKPDLEADYKTRLKQMESFPVNTGEKNDDNASSG